jgi:serine/threonine protein phosphatase PrpC
MTSIEPPDGSANHNNRLENVAKGSKAEFSRRVRVILWLNEKTGGYFSFLNDWATAHKVEKLSEVVREQFGAKTPSRSNQISIGDPEVYKSISKAFASTHSVTNQQIALEYLLPSIVNDCLNLTPEDMQTEGMQRVAPGIWTSNLSTASRNTEDFVVASEDAITVCDGMGGGSLSGHISRAVAQLSHVLLRNLRASKLVDSMSGKEVSEHVFSGVLKAINSSDFTTDTYKRAGTTVVFTTFDSKNVLKGGGTGDCAGFLFSNESSKQFYKAQRTSADRSDPGGGISFYDSSSTRHECENKISFEVQTKPDDLVLLCTDGITDSLHAEDPAQCLANIIANPIYNQPQATSDGTLVKAEDLAAKNPSKPDAKTATIRLQNYLASVIPKDEQIPKGIEDKVNPKFLDYAKKDDQGFVFKEV